MLDILTDGFRDARLKLKGKTLLTEENVSEALASIRRSLLDADVEYSVVKTFIQRVKDKALGEEVKLKAGSGLSKMKVSASDHFVKICHDELKTLMGPVDTSLNIPSNRPGIIMMVGLQGSGKTTTTGKLAHYLIHQKKQKPLLVAADIYRPAAVQQLKVLGERLAIPVFHAENSSPVAICEKAVQKAFELGRDVILFDTAGRLTIDEALMQELVDIKKVSRPDEIFLVCDAMMGQDAVTTAKSFNERLGLTGTIITKLDGDARGGAALSIKEVTGTPIKFLGMGESLEKLEEFRPEGLADRILGMGDIIGLMDDFSKVVDTDHEKDAMRMLQGQFTYIDFYKQVQTIQKMGSLKDIVAKLPMQDMIPKGANVDDKELIRIKAIIDSMTPRERGCLDPLNPSRVRRIAKGSGRREKEVDELVKKFSGMQKMMNMLGKNMGGLLGKIPGAGAMKQLGNLKNMANSMKQNGMAPGMMPSLGDMGSLMGDGLGIGVKKPPIDKDKQRKLRKAIKQARKKNRKK
jgi:signal recognition particle subunit SRP54